jgi:hypothetical protein
MLDGERLVAEQRVRLRDRQTLSVRISQHPVEEIGGSRSVLRGRRR